MQQAELLSWRPRGGRRRGAGRKRTSRHMPHVRRVPFRKGVGHVTARAIRGLPSLRTRRVVRAIEASFREGCERPDFRLVQYSIQRDHLHLIVEADDAASLGRGVRGLLIRVARAANRVWERAGAVIGDRYHFRLLRTPREVHHALRYVLRNAFKHRVRDFLPGAADPASSARWLEGWEPGHGDARDPPAVARARFWLLSWGWRRWGEIRPV